MEHQEELIEQVDTNTYKCPECGAPMRYNPESSSLHCDYCNRVINLENQQTDEEIDFFSRCLSIIDTYEAMAAPRAHRLSIPPFNILAFFEDSLSQFDVEILMPIMQRIANTQIGTNVQLSDESVWEVFILNNNRLSRPILRNDKMETLDLLMRPDLKIERVL